MAREKAMVYSHLLMVIDMKANLRKKILMAKVVSHIKMVGYMLVNGRIT